IAAFTDVDVAAGQFERRVDAHVGYVLDRLVDGEQRRDLDDAADAGDHDDGQDEAHGAAFDLAVKFGHLSYSAGSAAIAARPRCGTSWPTSPAAFEWPVIVMKTL